MMGDNGYSPSSRSELGWFRRRPGRVGELYEIGVDTAGCPVECEHKIVRVRAIRANNLKEAFNQYVKLFPEYAVDPERFLVLLNEVGGKKAVAEIR